MLVVETTSGELTRPRALQATQNNDTSTVNTENLNITETDPTTAHKSNIENCNKLIIRRHDSLFNEITFDSLYNEITM